MSTMAQPIDSKELDRRIAAGDAEIVSKRDALESWKTELSAKGVTATTISIDDSKELVAKQKEIDALKDDVVILRDLRSSVTGQASARQGSIGNREVSRFDSMHAYHDLVMKSPEYAALTAERLQGQVAIGNMPGIQVLDHEATIRRLKNGGNLFSAGPQAVAVATELDAGIPLDERLAPTLEILTRRIRLLDLVTVGSTTSDTVVYTRQTVRTPAAAETDLGVAYSEALFDFEQADANVRDIGHYTTAHRSQIADAGQFDTIVRNQLQEDVLLRLESQMYSGAGTGVLLEGMATAAGESITRDTTNETRVDFVHRGITTIRNNFREPTAVVLHPNDYQDVVFEKDGNERHLLQGLDRSPAFAPYMTVWGLPMVVTPVATEGVGLLGYFPDATLWVRSGVSLAVSDSHDDYFIKRQVAILAEMRAAFSVRRPDAFCELNLV